MPPGNDAAESPIFSAVIRPHRSLGGAGFLVLMLAIGSVSFIAGLVFVIAGAWPVTGIFGIDLVLIYWAFRVNYRAARAYEQVTVTAGALTVRRVNPRGKVAEVTFNPLWTRLDRETHEEFGIERLFLVSRGRRLAIAAFLGPQEKESFADALGDALARAKRGY
jgi:uncharacterized membrane protein